MAELSKKETVKLLFDSMEIIEKVVVPHRLLQKQLDHMIESIMEEIMIEVYGSDIGDHVMRIDNSIEFIREWSRS